MKLDTRFDVGERVVIKAIEQPAVVTCVKFEGFKLLYGLEYWWNGEIKTVWQFEDELTKTRPA